MLNQLFIQNNRGQVGIGTIIVFIAMILVASIAAGVLITTAGELQEQASQTGKDTKDQISNTVEVDGVIGTSDSGTQKIQTLNVSHSLSPGSSPVNIKRMTWTIETSSNVKQYNYNELSVADSNGDALYPISDNIQEDGFLINRDDRISVKFDLQSLSGISLEDSEKIVIKANSPSGGERIIRSTAPRYIKQEESSYRIG